MKTLGNISLLCLLSCAVAWGQGATAQIHGTVADASGAAVPGANVKATQTATGLTRTVVSSGDGGYVLTNLPLGPYRLEVSKDGFTQYVQEGIVLQVGSDPELNPALKVGTLSEQVVVEANATQVETRSAGVGSVMENQRILELPLNGRNVTDLIVLAGGATAAPNNGVSSASRDPFTSNITPLSIAGGVSFGVSYVLDGAFHNSPQTNQSLSTPFPDALQEFKVETSATSAQYGMHSAGAVTLVTKSGTNDLHGDLFEFVRNGKFNARNVFGTRRDTLKRNQFGGTLGGRIKKDRLFFFMGYQGTTLRQDPSDATGFVPTPAMLAGNFTDITSPNCNGGRAITLRAPFVNSQINPALFSPAALNLQKRLPQSTDPCGKIIYGNPRHLNEHMVVGKVDYQFNAKHSLFARYLADSLVDTAPYDLSHNLFSANVNGGEGLNQAFTLGDTYLVGPTTVNSLRLTFNRSSTFKTAGKQFSMADLGVKMFAYEPDLAKINITGSLPQASSKGPTYSDVFAIGDDVNLVRGSHQIGFGGATALWTSNAYSFFYASAIATFTGQITGLGMADFLTGNVSTFTEAPPDNHTGYERYLGLYAQDTWKARRNLTVNYGVRWEPYFPQVFTDGTTYHFDLNALAQGVRTTKYRNAPPGLSYPGDPGYPGNSNMNKQWNNFSPHLGLAWDPFGDGKTSVRAAFAMLHDFLPMGFLFGVNIAPPFDPRININSVKFDDPFQTFPGGNPFPTPVGFDAPFTPYSTYGVLNFDTKNPVSTQWNLSVQRQFGTQWLMTANYLGSNLAHLWSDGPLNPSVYIPGNCVAGQYGLTAAGPCSQVGNTQQRSVLSLAYPALGPYFGFVNRVDDGGTSSYNGLILTVQRRFARRFSLGGNYTWSHCISDPFTAIFNGGNGNTSYTHPDSRRADRGNCTVSAQDVRHLFNVSAVVESPRFSNRMARTLASGWRFSPILRIQSGIFLTATTSSDVALNGIAAQRVNQVLPDVFGSGNQYLNPKAFQTPANGTFGNLGVGNIQGPGTWGLDAALSRSFPIHERSRLELRGEAFNLTNSYRRMNPTMVLNSNIFGQVTSALDPRIMQFAFKYVF